MTQVSPNGDSFRLNRNITLDLPSAQVIQNWWSTSCSDSESCCVQPIRSKTQFWNSAQHDLLEIHLPSMWPAPTWSWWPLGYACWPPRRPAPSAHDGGPLPVLWDWCLGEERSTRTCMKSKWMPTLTVSQNLFVVPCVRTGSDIELGSPSPWLLTALMMNR